MPAPDRVPIRGAELCVDTAGDPADPPVLLMAGGAASMDYWEPGFCERLAAAGRYAIRYDHRDTGAATASPPGAPDYTGDDLWLDALAILDHLGIERAHLFGVSMGGALAQRIAIEEPGRVLSLTLMSTTLAAPGGDDDLPPMSDEMRAYFGGDGAPPEPDWADRDQAIEYMLAGERVFAGKGAFDDDDARALLGRVYDRSPSLPSAPNHFMLEGSDLEPGRLAEIACPTLVVHGTEDPLFPPGHAEALARAIPGAELLLIPGLGHGLQPSAWDAVLPAVISITSARA